MPSKNPAQRLSDIIDNIDAVTAFVAELDLQAFRADRKTVYAVVRTLEIVSEASRRLPKDLLRNHPEIDWVAIAAGWKYLSPRVRRSRRSDGLAHSPPRSHDPSRSGPPRTAPTSNRSDLAGSKTARDPGWSCLRPPLAALTVISARLPHLFVDSPPLRPGPA